MLFIFCFLFFAYFVYISFNQLLSQESVAEGGEACGSTNDDKIVLALDFVACLSKKRANIGAIFYKT